MGRAEEITDIEVLLPTMKQAVLDSREKDPRFAEGMYEALGIIELKVRVLTRAVENANSNEADIRAASKSLCTTLLRVILKDF